MSAFHPLRTFGFARDRLFRLLNRSMLAWRRRHWSTNLQRQRGSRMDRRRFLELLACGTLLGSCASVPVHSAPFRSERISIETRGSGPDVVLIPGLATSREVWAETVRAVPGYRYHLVEVAGFNGTNPAGNRAPGPLVRPLAEEVARYIREQRLVRPALVGHSLGGLMTLIIASRHPSLIDRAMVVDMPAFNGMNFGGPSATVESVSAMAPAARDRYFGNDIVKSRKNTENLYALFIQNEAVRPGIVKQALSSDREVSGRIFEETFALDLRTEVGAIRAPLTVLYTRAPNQPAANDRTDEIFRLAYQAAPHVKLQRVNDSGHFIMLDQPNTFQQELTSFLRR